MKHSLLRTGSLVALAVLLTSAVAAADAVTPLGKWMKPNMGAKLAESPPNFGDLKSNFDLLAGKSPSADYGQWATFAKAGSTAAAKSDLAGVKAACKQCHDSYRSKYQKEFVTRPFP